MPNDVLSVLGAQLRKARNERGYSQERLAEITNLSARHIANIEKGDVNPSFEVLSTLVKTLGISFDSIFNPACEQVDAEIQEITGLYQKCPRCGQRLILAAVRAMVNDLMSSSET